MLRSAFPMRPSAVSAPVWRTAAMPRPLTTSVPENTQGVASPPGAPIASVAVPGRAAVLRTGMASPVSAASSTVRFDAVDQHAVGGNAIAFDEEYDVAPDDVAAGDPLLLPVANDQRARRGEIAQCSERVLGLVLLVQRDGDHDDDERHQDDAVERLGEQEVQDAGADQEQQHRLSQHIASLLQEVARLRGGELVRPVRREPAGGVFLGQADDRRGVDSGSGLHGLNGHSARSRTMRATSRWRSRRRTGSCATSAAASMPTTTIT